MMNRQDRNIIIMYIATVFIVVVLVIVIMNFNTWFLSKEVEPQSGFTPVARDTVDQADIKKDVLSTPKFKSLGPLLTPKELSDLEASENPTGTNGGVNGGPSGGSSKKVREGNPFLPFAL